MAFRSMKTQPLISDELKQGIILPMLLAIGAVLVSFLWQGHMGISTADEGYLWYGAQRVMLGEVPVRDFYSYDPGRYYWVAMIMALLRSDGIIALRIANAITQAMGLFLALFLLGRTAKKRSFLFSLAATIILIFWMFPWFKLFDISLSIVLIGILSFLIERPTRRRYFLTGLYVGFIAALCRQQGTFGAMGSLGSMVYLALKRQQGPGFAAGFLIWFGGVITGYLPVFLMLALVPGYALAFWDSLHVYSFLPLAVPWPWLAPFGRASVGAVVRWMLSGLFFMAPVIFGVVGMAWTIFQKFRQRSTPSVLVASAFLSLPYALYVFVAPDVSRLGLGLFPFLMGFLTMLNNLRARAKWLLVWGLCAASILVMLPNHPGWSRKRYVEIDLSGDRLKIYPADAAFFTMLNKLAKDYAPNGRGFIALPRFATSYAALRRKSPMYDIYSLFPRSKDFQLSEIRRIELSNPGFAVIDDNPGFMRFRDIRPIIFQYILNNFEPLPGYAELPGYLLFKSKQ